jgi:hypothetical protein
MIAHDSGWCTFWMGYRSHIGGLFAISSAYCHPLVPRCVPTAELSMIHTTKAESEGRIPEE